MLWFSANCYLIVSFGQRSSFWYIPRGWLVIILVIIILSWPCCTYLPLPDSCMSQSLLLYLQVTVQTPSACLCLMSFNCFLSRENWSQHGPTSFAWVFSSTRVVVGLPACVCVRSPSLSWNIKSLQMSTDEKSSQKHFTTWCLSHTHTLLLSYAHFPECFLCFFLFRVA